MIIKCKRLLSGKGKIKKYFLQKYKHQKGTLELVNDDDDGHDEKDAYTALIMFQPLF